MTPVALAVARLPGGPPSQVTFLPAFWLLVPGALGLIGVTEIVGDPARPASRISSQPIGAIVSIALGDGRLPHGIAKQARHFRARAGRGRRRLGRDGSAPPPPTLGRPAP